jgi:hypothetical protein
MVVEKIKELYLSGLSTYQVAKELNLKPNFVWTTLKNNGVKLRTKKEALQKYAKYDNCIICGERFRVRPQSGHGNHYRKTCKPECESIYRSKRISETYTEERKEHLRQLFTGRDTSTWNIPRGEKSSSWKGGCGSDYYRYLAFEVYHMEQKCSVVDCETPHDLSNICVHHIDEDRTNNKKENLMILCKAHHTGNHSKGNALWIKHLEKS